VQAVPEPLLSSLVITRRDVALGGVLATVWNGCCAAAGASEPGCVIAGETADRLFARAPAETLNPDYFNRISMGSGDKALDFALAQTLSRITEAFHVLPGFVFYEDRDSANSFATPRLRFPKTDGTILLGTRFLKQILARSEDPEIALTAICAHEFAHVLQFKRGLLDALFAGEPTVRRCELHADFFAGYFAGKRKKQMPNYPAAVFAVALSTLKVRGGFRRDHGTSAQRAAAIVRGFEASYNEGLSLDDAIVLSMTYVGAA
jgi:hypothetical protein